MRPCCSARGAGHNVSVSSAPLIRLRPSLLPQLSLLLLLLLSPGACRIGAVDPIPLRGQAPRTVLVWPLIAGEFAAHERDLLTGLDQALVRRGYEVTSTAVARQLLTERGLLTSPPPALDRLRGELGVDAVLFLVVREFAPVGERFDGAKWDLLWELQSTRGGGVQWEFDHHGSWYRNKNIDEDPLRPIETEPGLVPPAARVEPSFRDAADLAAWLHRLAMDHLPSAAP